MLVFVNKNKEKFVERMNVFDDKSDNLEAELGEVEQYITQQEDIEFRLNNTLT